MQTFKLEYCEDNPAAWLKATCEAPGLELSLPTHLASYPGCVHWHIAHPGARGVLEVTWWPCRRRFWLKVAANRDAPWIEGAIELIRAWLAREVI